MLFNLYRRHLYVRIWLAVVGGVVILTLCANWIVREAAENERERLSAVPREVVCWTTRTAPLAPAAQCACPATDWSST